jgi:hypothetical protein
LESLVSWPCSHSPFYTPHLEVLKASRHSDVLLVLRPVLILFAHLCLGISNGLSHSAVPTERFCAAHVGLLLLRFTCQVLLF